MVTLEQRWLWMSERRRLGAFAGLAVLALLGCGETASTPKTLTSALPVTITEPLHWQQPSCQRLSPSSSLGPGTQEIQGDASPPGTEFWALAPQPIRSPVEKIVWKMTGSGPFFLYADGPSQLQVMPDRLQQHLGSDWQRAGDEWGGNLPLPVSGCWEVHAYRNGESATMHFMVT